MYYTSREIYEFIAQHTNDPIVEWKTCKISGQPFGVFQSEKDFYDKVSPVFNGVKYQMPTPTLCPEERQRRRLMFRNERKLYNRKCDATGKHIITIYSPDKPYKVYEQDFWWGDGRNPLDYGKDFDFSKSFSQQFQEISLQVPKLAVMATQNENSVYVNGAAYNKNCYLIFASDYNEDCMYADNIDTCRDVVDASDSNHSTSSYQLIGSNNCFNSLYCIDCHDSRDLLSCFDCKSCQNCCMCSWLRNQKYCFQNKQYTKEEYENLLQTHLQQRVLSYHNSEKHTLHRAFYGLHNESAFGNYITNCKSVSHVYSASELQDCRYLINGNQCNDCQDSYVIVEQSQFCYENLSSIALYRCCFTIGCWNTGRDLYYCDHCQWCKNCFGCIALRNKEYCILNKQYTREEYEALVPKIIQQMKKDWVWGEFFDPSLSPFGYNETVAYDEYPLTASEAHSRGYQWQQHTYDPVISDGTPVLRKDEIPVDPNTVSDDILSKIIICEISGRPFRFEKRELEFYRKHHLPLPRKHHDVRHEERLTLKPSRKLFLRTCDNCNTEMLSVYNSFYVGKVYCEACYEKAMY